MGAAPAKLSFETREEWAVPQRQPEEVSGTFQWADSPFHPCQKLMGFTNLNLFPRETWADLAVTRVGPSRKPANRMGRRCASSSAILWRKSPHYSNCDLHSLSRVERARLGARGFSCCKRVRCGSRLAHSY